MLNQHLHSGSVPPRLCITLHFLCLTQPPKPPCFYNAEAETSCILPTAPATPQMLPPPLLHPAERDIDPTQPTHFPAQWPEPPDVATPGVEACQGIQSRVSVLAVLSRSRQALGGVGDRAGPGSHPGRRSLRSQRGSPHAPRLQGFTCPGCPPTCLSTQLPRGSGSPGCASSSKSSTSSSSPCLPGTAPRAAPATAPRSWTAARETRTRVSSSPVSTPTPVGAEQF